MLDKRSLYSRLWIYIKPHRGRIALSMFGSLLCAGADGSMARLIQPFVDKVIVAKDAEMIFLVPWLILGLQLVKATGRYLQEYFIKTAGQLAIQSIRNDLFSHVMNLSMRFFGKNPTGVLMSKHLNDVQSLQSSLAEVLVGAMRDLVTLLALIGVAFYTDWKMAAIAFVVLPLAAWPISIIGQRIKSYARKGQGIMGELSRTLEQSFSGIKVIKGFGAEAEISSRFKVENLSYYRTLSKVFKYDAGSSPFIEIVTGIGMFAIIRYGMEQVQNEVMTVGQLFSICGAIMLMYAPFKRLTKFNNYLQIAMGAAERVFAVLDEPLEIRDQEKAIDLGAANGAVVFDDVSFAYDDDQPVLSNLSLVVNPGEVVALVGPSGAGKTTISALLCRFYDATSGVITIDGHNITEITLASLKQNLAMVDQESFLFNETIADNIRLSKPQATDAEVIAAAKQAYADEFIAVLPEGYQTRIGDRGLRLSGGQRQRICIARALLRNAPILILDEATSALDTESEAMVQQALVNLMHNRTTFVIAHRLSTIMHADKIVVLEHGHIVEVGRHGELLVHENGLYRRLYDMQFREA
ncbi:MAG: ABC transporter permease [Deltaproteobacteria bacterium HGW-Deltaproteobacteria-4]|nr:MAG: ABC transporter permease [Deltaproteobacteria bacterium HGW-Deltaproteobacteria-4]